MTTKVEPTVEKWGDETPQPGYKDRVILRCVNNEKHPCPCGCHKSGSDCENCNGVSVKQEREHVAHSVQEAKAERDDWWIEKLTELISGHYDNPNLADDIEDLFASLKQKEER